KSIRTTDAGVKIKYSHSKDKEGNYHDTWTFDGNVTITTQPQGTGNQPALSNVSASLGLELQDGDFHGIDFSIAGAFPLLGLQVQTDPGKSLDCQFVGDEYEVRGSLMVTAKDATTGNANFIDVNFGDVVAGQEGIIIQDGQVTQFIAAANADFTLFGAQIS